MPLQGPAIGEASSSRQIINQISSDTEEGERKNEEEKEEEEKEEKEEKKGEEKAAVECTVSKPSAATSRRATSRALSTPTLTLTQRALHAHHLSPQHRQTRDDAQQAELLFSHVYQHQDNVDDVPSESTIELPDIELLCATFRKRLLDLQGEDAGIGQQGAASEWTLVRTPSGGVFRRSSTGAREYITYARPEPSSEDVSENPLLDATRLAKDVAAGDTIINGLTVQAGSRRQAFPLGWTNTLVQQWPTSSRC